MASSGGYQTIGGGVGGGVSGGGGGGGVSVSATSAPADGGESGLGGGYQAVAAAASATGNGTDSGSFNVHAAAASAKDAVVSAWHGEARAPQIYTEPLAPGSGLSARDRLTLVLESCRPWMVFFDFKQFNLPGPSEVKLRYAANVETFFYNYLTLAFGFALLFLWTRPLSVLALLVAVQLAIYLHVIHPEPIQVHDAWVIDTRGKYIAEALVAFLALFVFGGFGVLYAVAIFTLFVVGIHGLFRDHTA